MTTRRSFLGSILALAAAPAIVRAESLMPVAPRIWVPPAPAGRMPFMLQEFGLDLARPRGDVTAFARVSGDGHRFETAYIDRSDWGTREREIAQIKREILKRVVPQSWKPPTF